MSTTALPHHAVKSIMALLALAFLLIPGPALPLVQGLPIRTAWFFVGVFVWVLVFTLWPWRRDVLRQAPLLVGLAGVAVVIKLVAAVLFIPNGLVGRYEARRAPYAGKVLMTRRDPVLDFQDDSFYPRQRGLCLSMLNTNRFLGATRDEIVGMPLRVRWNGFIELNRRGTYRFAARCTGSWQISLDGRLVASRLHGKAGGAYRNDEPGLHMVSVLWEHPAEHTRPEFRLYWCEPTARPPSADVSTAPEPACTPDRVVPRRVLFPLLLGPGESSAQEVVRTLGWVALGLAAAVLALIVFGQWRSPRGMGRVLARRLAVLGICGISFVAATSVVYHKARKDRHWHALGQQDHKIYIAQGHALNDEGWSTHTVGQFHRSSLMRYYCAVGLWLTEGHLGYFAMLQGLLGGVTATLVYVLGRVAFRRTLVAMAAATLTALEPSLLEFSGKFYAATLTTLLLVATLACLAAARRRHSIALCMSGMMLYGLTVLARTNLLMAAPAMAVWCLGPNRWPWRHRLMQAVLGVAAFAAVYSVVPLVNRHHTRLWLLTPTQGPVIAFHGNNVPRDIDHRQFYPADTRIRRWLDHTMDCLLDFDRNPKHGADVLDLWKYPYVNPYLRRIFVHYCTTRPLDFLGQLGVKTAEFFWINTERRGGGNGGVRFRPYTIALGLAIVCWLVVRRDPYAALLMGVVLLTAAGLILFLFVERHRMPLVPLLHLLGVWAAVTIAERVRARRAA